MWQRLKNCARLMCSGPGSLAAMLICDVHIHMVPHFFQVEQSLQEIECREPPLVPGKCDIMLLIYRS